MEEHDDEEFTMFDRTSLLGMHSRRKRATNCNKLWNTFALCGAFFGVVSEFSDSLYVDLLDI